MSKKPLTKSQLVSGLAEQTGLTKKEVSSLLGALESTVSKEIKRGSGQITLPGLVKIVKVNVPKRPAQANVPNPFKPGEYYDRPAKPAHNKVKVRVLKNLKEMAS